MSLFNPELLLLQISEFCDLNKDSIDKVVADSCIYKIQKSNQPSMGLTSHLSKEELQKLKEAVDKKIFDAKNKEQVELFKISDEHSIRAYVPIDRPDIVKALMEKAIDDELEYSDFFSHSFKVNARKIKVDADNLSELGYDLITDLKQI